MRDQPGALRTRLAHADDAAAAHVDAGLAHVAQRVEAVGQHSDKGRNALNQDFHGVAAPKEPLLSAKGIAIALADGIGSSDVSQVASEFAVMGLLDDYYCTRDAWSAESRSNAC